MITLVIAHPPAEVPTAAGLEGPGLHDVEGWLLGLAALAADGCPHAAGVLDETGVSHRQLAQLRRREAARLAGAARSG